MKSEHLYSNPQSSRPPARLPNGKANPEYTKWWRSTEKSKAYMEKWNRSEAAKKACAKYRSSEKGRRAKELEKTSRRSRYPIGSRKCIECGVEYGFDRILASGWKTIGKYHCVCDLCS